MQGIVLWAIFSSLACCLAVATSCFKIRLLSRPSQFLEIGILHAQQGRLEPIQISLFNVMAEVLTAGKEESRQNQSLVEE
jgi:hypothetical protein